MTDNIPIIASSFCIIVIFACIVVKTVNFCRELCYENIFETFDKDQPIKDEIDNYDVTYRNNKPVKKRLVIRNDTPIFEAVTN